jgi:hypothetical protein
MKQELLRRILLGIGLLLPLLSGAQAKTASYTVMREPGYASTLSLIITSEDGRIIRGNYIFELRDTATKTSNYSYAYGLDSKGAGTEKTIPPGVYDLIDVRTSQPFLRSVQLVRGKRNIVSTKVPMGTLRFQTEGKPEVVVKDLQAKVLPMYADGDTIVQLSSEAKSYLPGEYFIEVNTLPVSRFRVDVDWDTVTLIELAQTGELQLSNLAALEQISLYRLVNKTYEKFIDLSLAGQADTTLSLKPGTYQLRYSKPKLSPKPQERNKEFEVQAGVVTKLDLD